MNNSLALGLGFSFTLLTGCAANFTVSGHADSAAFARGRCHIVVEPLKTAGIVVGGKSESAYLANKKERSIESYENDKVVSEQQFRDKLMAKNGVVFTPAPAQPTFVVRPTWTSWEPGYYAGWFSKAGVASLSLDVLGPDGKIVDKVSIQASATDYATGDRMRVALRNAGNGASHYISENWQCAR